MEFLHSIPAALKSGFVAVHLLGLVLGLGAATMLDLIISRFLLINRITSDYWRVIHLLSKVVSIGLILLWASGCAFLVHYLILDPGKLQNPKIWAKIAIVAILTLNGVFIHAIVLPLVRARIGRFVFDGLTSTQRTVLLASGAISGVSWWIPLILGAFPQLNFAVPATTILLVYGILLTLAIGFTQVVARFAVPPSATVTLPRAEYDALITRLAQLTSESLAKLANPRSKQMRERAVYRLGRFLSGLESISRARSSFRSRVGAVIAMPTLALALLIFVGPPAPIAFKHHEGLNELGGSNSEQLEYSPMAVHDFRAELPLQTSPQTEGAQSQTGYLQVSQLDPSSSEASKQAPAEGEEDTATIGERLSRSRPRAAYAGIWGPHISACSAQESSVRQLPAVINEDGVWAGETFCAFTKKEQSGNVWTISAKCSNGHRRWTTNVRLTVTRDRLTWTSKRGSQKYERCDRTVEFADVSGDR